VASAYLQLTKPRIISLLLITTVPSMILADRGLPSLWLIAATLVGGMLTAGGANAINQFVDRDIDEIMSRTRGRPLPGHRVEPRAALVFGIALGIVGFVWLALVVNLLAGLLAVAAILFYVFVYTAWLKRVSPQNIVIGGAAGAVPVLVGWAAVTNTVALPAWVMFAIVFTWTPPHFWALAVRYQGDYAAAGVPMLPVVAGERSTARQILVYAVVLVGVTLLLWPAAHTGPIYPRRGRRPRRVVRRRGGASPTPHLERERDAALQGVGVLPRAVVRGVGGGHVGAVRRVRTRIERCPEARHG
jgi:protoheme IX farnesyltransferase